eukprot:m.158779 g.158779  ORF g.158779 m.158779 type:complete len:310 (+) comp17028_c4_seq2:910-1839(+)
MRDRLQELLGGAKETAIDMPEGEVHVAPVHRGDDDDEDEQRQPYLAEFFAEVQEISDALGKIESLVDTVREKHNVYITAVEGEKAKTILASIQDLMSEITAHVTRTRKAIKTMDEKNKKMEKDKMTSGGLDAEMRIRKSQHTMLARKFMQVMTKYNDVQQANSKQYRELVHREMKIVDPSVQEDKINEVIEHGVQGIFQGKREFAEAYDALEKIQNRHQGILALEKSLLELHEMFLDLAILVESQGEMIDRIEFSVDNAATYTHHAVTELKGAQKNQKKARKKKYMIACCCVIMLAVLVILLASLIPRR